MSDALDDWLADGLGGVSDRIVSLYRDTIAKALREQLGASASASKSSCRSIRNAG